MQAGRPTDTETVAAVRGAIGDLSRRAQTHPHDIRCSAEAAWAWLRLAEQSVASGSPDEALDSLDRAEKMLRPAIQTHPGILRLLGLATRLEATRGEVLRQRGDSQGAAQAAERAVRAAETLTRSEPAYLYDLARARALQAGLEPTANSVALAGIAALHRAIEAGFDNLHKLQTDEHLAALRTRAAFRELVRSLEQRPGPTAGHDGGPNR